MKETRGIIILLCYTENATLKQTLNGAFPTAQHLALSVWELTETLQSHPFIIEINVFLLSFFHQYINRPLPSTAHAARHSFQFNACTALLDGHVTPASFMSSYRRRPQLNELLKKTVIETPADNIPTFHDMYVEIEVRRDLLCF